MSENKFIKRLKGEQTAKSVLEIKNESAKTSFANMPQGTSNAINVYSDHRGNATAVLEGTDIWKLNNSLFVVTPDAFGDGRDFTSTYTVFGSSLWVNATYTFAQPKIFTGATQWVLKLCGHSLLSRLSNTIGFSLIIKFGNTTTITKSFSVSENAFEFCKEFIIDFSESEQAAIKVAAGDTMTVQLLCADATASATIYNGMTTLVAQQRRVDGEAVASNLHTFEDLEVEIAEIQDDIESIQDDIADINGKIIVRSATIPTASADLVGKAYQYAGTTNGQYTHNYIYECVAGETTYDGLIGFDPAKIAFDYTKGNLAEFFSDTTPNFAQITHGTFTYLAAGDLWAISGQDANENVLFDNYKLYTQDLEDAGFVFINPPQDYTDGEVIDYTVTFTPQPTTYSWVRVDVQPDRITQIQALQADVSDIQALIPAQASPTNQLGDKNFINSSIATNTANFIGTFNSVAELEAYSGTVTNNDYAFVIGTDSAGNTTYNRYKYNANTQQWIYEYTLNNSSFTANQWASINSGVTASDVSKARSAVQPSDLGNGTITLTQGGTPMGSFTTNQSSDTIIALDGGSSYHPDLFDFKWADYILDDAQWLMANTFSWQYGSMYQAAYQHLVDDVDNIQKTILYRWRRYVVSTYLYVYTLSATPAVGDAIYQNPYDAYYQTDHIVESVPDSTHISMKPDGSLPYAYDGSVEVTIAQRETIAGTTIVYYQADDGHKICPASEESNVLTIYNATGVAWYYIIDTTNQRFKLPRAKHNKYANSLGVVGNGITLGLTDGNNNGYSPVGTYAGSINTIGVRSGSYGQNLPLNTGNNSASAINGINLGVTTDPTKSGMIAQQEQDTDQYKYLYFYVGAFTQTAIENTAGLNTELFNGKADLNLLNTASNIDFVIERQEPTAANNYTWYRKYKSGWVEQGGVILNAGTGAHTITIPVEMASVDELKKSAITTPIFINGTIQNQGVSVRNSNDSSWSTTQIDCYSWGATIHIKWQVSGMAA